MMMDQNILIALIGVGSAFIGTIVGGVISYFANKSMKQFEWQHSVKSKKIELKLNLYAAFLSEVTNLVLDSNDSKISSASELKKITGLLMEIELIASNSVYSKAAVLSDAAVYLHVKEDQKSSSFKTTPYPEARIEFIEAAKNELAELECT